MPVHEVMTPSPAFVLPETPVLHAARLMRDLGLRALPVCADDEVIGLLTVRDIVVGHVAHAYRLELAGAPMTAAMRHPRPPERVEFVSACKSGVIAFADGIWTVERDGRTANAPLPDVALAESLGISRSTALKLFVEIWKGAARQPGARG
jgi:hypothetical protein